MFFLVSSNSFRNANLSCSCNGFYDHSFLCQITEKNPSRRSYYILWHLRMSRLNSPGNSSFTRLQQGQCVLPSQEGLSDDKMG